ncbi:DNA-binding protein Fis [Tepidimonas fonticaldi]|uniref:Putative Fis-like DNA-binding protein n=1 Tax=Tepidimonas fonticaldi TaxID=1101373 RepID=A0A1A6DT92_9BURK|nr:helix-turn-helix domain-containing protein [Tepidimonas fonticaldi]OBS30015.1 Fis family transcriptional regulator [Tepidimonas fonticaldi]TSE36628.1 DNA-binding protein Fis [Tepidimonas fonticaldi]
MDPQSPHLPDCVRESLDAYFATLADTEPANLHEMLIRAVEKPLLEVVMARARGNQSRAAQWLGLNRNTLRKKLLEHGLLDG